jgi:hypothetical protein
VHGANSCVMSAGGLVDDVTWVVERKIADTLATRLPRSRAARVRAGHGFVHSVRDGGSERRATGCGHVWKTVKTTGWS